MCVICKIGNDDRRFAKPIIARGGNSTTYDQSACSTKTTETTARPQARRACDHWALDRRHEKGTLEEAPQTRLAETKDIESSDTSRPRNPSQEKRPTRPASGTMCALGLSRLCTSGRHLLGASLHVAALGHFPASRPHNPRHFFPLLAASQARNAQTGAQDTDALSTYIGRAFVSQSVVV